MTKGKMVLELLIYAKSAIKKFRPIRGLHCGHVTFKGGWDAWYLNIERRNSATAMLAMYHLLLTKDTMETIDQGDLLSMKSRETILTTLRWRTAGITMMGRTRRATGSMRMIKTVTWYPFRSNAYSTVLSILQYFIQYLDFMLMFVCWIAVCSSV